MNTAKKGRRKEHQVRDLFEERGYVVTRAAGSKGPFDLIAIPTLGRPADDNPQDRVILVQVKPRTIYASERGELEGFRSKICAGCRIEGWVVEDRQAPRRQFEL